MSAADSKYTSLHTGWGEKRVVVRGCLGRKVMWKRKYLVLSTSARLSFAVDQEGKEEDGMDISPDTPVEYEGHDGCTLLVCARENWAFRFASREETETWLGRLRECKQPKAENLASPSPTELVSSPSPPAPSAPSPEDAEKRAEMLRQMREKRQQRKESIQLEAMQALASIDNLEE